MDSWTTVESTVLSDFFDGFMALCVSGCDIMVILYVRSIQHVGEWYPYGGGWLGVDSFINELLGMWVCGYVSKKSTIISTTVKTAKKRNKGRLPKNNTPTSIFQEADNGIWWIGQVQMMRRKFGTKRGLCRQPIDLQKNPKNLHLKGSTMPTFAFMISYFSSAPCDLKSTMTKQIVNGYMQIQFC